jgi:hypothetical protein
VLPDVAVASVELAVHCTDFFFDELPLPPSPPPPLPPLLFALLVSCAYFVTPAASNRTKLS